MKAVKQLRYKYGDGQALSEWHRRELGYDNPAVDLDKPMIEYESAMPAGLLEYKHYNVGRIDPYHPSIKALREWCAARTYEIPFYVVKYAPDCSSFLLYPMNTEARAFVGGNVGDIAPMTAREFKEFHREIREFQKQRRAS